MRRSGLFKEFFIYTFSFSTLIYLFAFGHLFPLSPDLISSHRQGKHRARLQVPSLSKEKDSQDIQEVLELYSQKQWYWGAVKEDDSQDKLSQ